MSIYGTCLLLEAEHTEECAVWVEKPPGSCCFEIDRRRNDTPNGRRGDHGFIYDGDRLAPVAVSFEARNGAWVRASFDPETGEVTTFTLKRAGAPAP